MEVEKRLSAMGVELFTDIKPIGSYTPFSRTGNIVCLSGQGPSVRGKYESYIGKVGAGISKEEGYEAARLTAVNLISILKLAVGDLDKVKRIVNLHGYVNSTDDFTEQPFVINGASDLLIAAFGEKGRHSRCALSVNSLPLGICVEAELTADVEA